MWEDLTIALCVLGFAAAVALVVAELRPLLEQVGAWSAARRRHHLS